MTRLDQADPLIRGRPTEPESAGTSALRFLAGYLGGHSMPAPLRAQNSQIRRCDRASYRVTFATHIGGYTRVLSLRINHALRSASDTKAAGAAAPRVRA